MPRAQRDGPFAVLEEFLVRTNLLHDLIAVETPDAQRTVLAVARLMRFVADWQREHPRDSLIEFVAYLDVYQQVGGDLDTDQLGRVEVEGVQLMTVYQAKGLEYEVVVVPRLVEGQFPDTRDESGCYPGRAAEAEAAGGLRDRRGATAAVRGDDARQDRLLLTALQPAGTRTQPSRFVGELARGGATGREPMSSDDYVPSVAKDVTIEKRAQGPQAEVDEVLRRTYARRRLRVETTETAARS